MTPEVSPAGSAAVDRFRGDRLPFTLPDFTRVSWVSDAARGTWEPRLSRIGGAWADIEWRSVAGGLRACALTSVSSDALVSRTAEWATRGLSALPVAMSCASSGYASTSIAPRVGEPFEYRVAVGSLGDLSAFKQAMDGGDDGAIGRLLGFPRCCIDFFRRVWVDDGCVDTTWAMAGNGGRLSGDGHAIDIEGAPFQANILWRWAGPRAVPHLPCSFACEGTVAFADALVGLARQAGYHQEMDWLEEVLSWPVSWSALHGIAEVKTPILKVSTRTDATGHEFLVRRHGTRLPPEALPGLDFPFKEPARPRVTHSLAFRRGLEAPIAVQAEMPEWYATDNGFSVRAAMDDAHRPIVELALESLGEAGTVLDLGCGNGALLKKVAEAREGVIPFGVDVDEQKLEHARLLQPAFGGNFVAGSMFERIPLDEDTVYSLIILMPGRLLEVDEHAAARLRQWVAGHFRHLLLYAYGDWLTRYGGLAGLAGRAGFTLEKVHRSGAAALARLRPQTRESDR